LSEKQRSAVEVVSLDLWAAYAGAASLELPNAAQVYDRFHLSGYLNDAVDITRRAENKRLAQAGDDQLKGTRYLWLRSPATLTEKQIAQLASFSASDLATAAVWRLKEGFRDFFACTTEAAATDFFQQWKTQVLALGNTHLMKVANMFERHWDGLLAWVHHPVTNAIAESLNERIQQLKAKARGFCSASVFRRAILFHLGSLTFTHKLSRSAPFFMAGNFFSKLVILLIQGLDNSRMSREYAASFQNRKFTSFGYIKQV
ncbi:MAG: transposase, partial [Acidobacteriota bacterium]